MSNTLYIPVGIPAIGKTTFGKEMAKENPYLILISSDMIRKEIFGEQNDSDSDIWVTNVVLREMQRRTEEALKNGFSVYYDGENTGWGSRTALIKQVRALIKQVREYVTKIVAIQFPLDTKKAFFQNELRSEKVGNSYISRIASSISMPKKEEGFDEIVRL